MRADPDMQVTALGNWYGSNRTLAPDVGRELAGCRLVNVGCLGGGCELPYIDAGKIICNDRHRHIINLARVIADRTLGPQLYRRARRQVFAPEVLEQAQALCSLIDLEMEDQTGLFAMSQKFDVMQAENRLDWAEAYWIATWMGRGGKSGAKGEFEQGLSVRFDPDGGGSAQRYRSATASLMAWRRVLRRCEFQTLDVFEFLARAADKSRVGVYCDPPFAGPGDVYTHQLGPRGQERLAEAVSRFTSARVVMRFYDHPLIRELYPEGDGPGRWTWVRRAGRTQANSERVEVLVINGASMAKG